MDLTERQGNGEVAQRHPWEQSRCRFFCGIALEAVGRDRPVRILDAGAGDGWFATQLLQRLPQGSSAVCWDVFYSDEDLQELSEATPDSCSFVRRRPRQKSFDLTLALDVIEHVPNPRAFLMDLRATLNEGGHLLVSVPAWNILFSSHDRALKHYRRYSPGALRRELAEAGFTLELDGGLFHSLLPVRVLQKTLEAIRPPPLEESQLKPWTAGPALTNAIVTALSVDNQLSRWAASLGLPLPGLSCWALCRPK